jgi:hypothetical protein
MTGEPAPRRQIFNGTRISGSQFDYLTRLHSLQILSQLDHECPATDIAGIPPAITLIWLHAWLPNKGQLSQVRRVAYSRQLTFCLTFACSP